MTETILIDTSILKEEEKEVSLMVAGADKFVVKNQETLLEAKARLDHCVSKAKFFNDKRLSITRPMDLAKKTAKEMFDVPINALNRAEKYLRAAMDKYNTEQADKMQELQDKINREAEAKARKERERLEASAKKWEEKGKTEKAEEIRERAEDVTAMPDVVLAEPEKIAGISWRNNWKGEVFDESLLPEQYFTKTVNQKVIDVMVKESGGKIKIPGVRNTNKKTMVNRAA